MYVKQIVSIDKYSGEADIIVSDGVFDLQCYDYQPIKTELNMEVDKLSTLFADNIIRSFASDYLIKKLPDYYAYHLRGKVTDINIPTVSIGDLKVNLDKPLPGDIAENEFVEFNVQRIDCFMKTKR